MPLHPPYRVLVGLQAVILTVTALYFGRPVLLPLVTAILVTFLLRPAALWLERHRVPRPVAVGFVALGVLLALGSVAYLVTQQLHDLASNLDEYRGHMRTRIQKLQGLRTRAFENVRGL